MEKEKKNLLTFLQQKKNKKQLNQKKKDYVQRVNSL